MLKVCVGKGGSGYVPSIESDDDSMWLAEAWECRTPQEACAEAAKRLREAAARFELLAKEKMITYKATHDKINAAPVTL